MAEHPQLEGLFVVTAFLFQIILVLFFALRKWRFKVAVRYGPIVYALSIPAAVVSLLLLRGEAGWTFWLGGFLYLIWAGFGYIVEYVLDYSDWRNPIRWQILIPYVILYLGSVMFYWWPLAEINKSLWLVYAALFVVASGLNITSHKKT